MKKEFKDILKELRKEKGLSQEGLGEILNVSRSAIAKYENGLCLPSEDVIESMIKYFNVSKDYLFPLDDVLEIITDKNIKINKQKNKFIIVISSLLLVISILLASVFYIGRTNRVNKLDDKNTHIDISEKDNKFMTIWKQVCKYKGGYVYQDIVISKIEFTDISNLYFIYVKNSYTNGNMAHFNGSDNFSKREFTVKTQLDIDFEKSKYNINLIGATPLYQSKSFEISSLYSDGEILINEDMHLFGGVSIVKGLYDVYYSYTSMVPSYLFNEDYTEQLRQLTIDSSNYKTGWEYEMLTDKAKWQTFDLHATYLFEAVPNQTIIFDLNTKMVNTHMSVTQKNIVELSV